LSDRKLKSLPPDPFRHQDSAIAHVALPKRSFKRKDDVENYVARQIKDGKIGLKEAQQGIAEDWTQFLDDALAVKLGKKK